MCLAACSAREAEEPAFVGVPVDAGVVDNRFVLLDHHGTVRRMEDFRGKVVALFFGYTHCPDVCPTTMADFAEAMSILGDRRSEVQVLFVTLDPERDTQQVLAQYVPAFDPAFLGLRGDSATVADVAKRFNIFYRRQIVGGGGRYTIDHTASVYVFDRHGVPRLGMNYGLAPKDIAHDLELLIREN